MRRIVSTFVFGLLLVGCGSSAPTTPPTTSNSTSPTSPTRTESSVYVPPGVDSSTASRADSLAEESFVSLEKQKQAAARVKRGESLVQVSDSLWKYLEMASDTTEIDSVSQKKKNAAIRAYNRGADSLRKYQKITRAAEIDSAKLAQMQADLLAEAQKAFEEAIKLNPYDEVTRSRLAAVYKLRAERLGRQKAYRKAIEIYEKLTRLRKDQPELFLALANAYYKTEQYEKAAENYREARKTYLQSVKLSLDSVQVDSARVFEYVLAEADAYRFARDAEQSLEAYRLAKSYAVTSEQRERAQTWIEWVNWDDGNIAASFARDSLKTLAAQGNYAAAARGFKTLKPKLRTQSARDEIDWRLAKAQYQSGEQDQAAERLQALFKRTETGPNGSPVDSTYQRYFNTYGTICLNLGRKYLGKNNQTALKYLEQSAQVPWKKQALAELEVGKLLRSGSPKKAVEYLERALEEKEALELESQKSLYRYLVNLHSRLGNRQKALEYRKSYRRLGKQAGADSK